MKHKIHHGLQKELARKATHKAIETYKARFEQYNPQANWVNDDTANVSFSAKGIKLEGALEIVEHDVLLDLEVPFLLRPFRSRAMTIIEEEIKDWVARAKRGELD
ncbi:MAG: polyhydroxyalkanoic acid system family protein [Bradymonadaceae bacterium]